MRPARTLFLTLLTLLTVNLLIIAVLAPTLLGYFVAKVTQAFFGMSFFVPQIVVVVSPQNATHGTTNLPLNYSVFNLSAVDVWYILDNGPRVNLTGNRSIAVSETGHNITVFADDRMGNRTGTGVLFYVNTKPAPPSTGGGGAGGGGRGFVLPPNFTVDKDSLAITLHQGEAKTAQITLTNNGGQELKITRTYKNLDSFIAPETYQEYYKQGDYDVILSKPGERQESFQLKIGDKETIGLLFRADSNQSVGNYVGSIILEGGSRRKEIPVTLNVLPAQPLFNLTVHIPEESRRLTPGEQLVAEVALVNLLPGKADVNIIYQIKNTGGAVLYQIDENETVEGGLSYLISETQGSQRQISFLKATNLSTQLEPGNYILAVAISYGNTVVSVDSDVFQIIVLALPLRGLGGFVIPWLLAQILGILAAVLFVVWLSYRIYRIVLRKTAPYRYYKSFGFSRKKREIDLLADFS